jgi:hypothetical protein
LKSGATTVAVILDQADLVGKAYSGPIMRRGSTTSLNSSSVT